MFTARHHLSRCLHALMGRLKQPLEISKLPDCDTRIFFHTRYYLIDFRHQKNTGNGHEDRAKGARMIAETGRQWWETTHRYTRPGADETPFTLRHRVRPPTPTSLWVARQTGLHFARRVAPHSHALLAHLHPQRAEGHQQAVGSGMGHGAPTQHLTWAEVHLHQRTRKRANMNRAQKTLGQRTQHGAMSWD